jgi:hypothetical protein
MALEPDPDLLSCFASMWKTSGSPLPPFVPDQEISQIASALAEQFNSFCRDTLATRTYTDGVSSLTFQFLPRREVNAYAFRRDQNAFIAANLGVLAALLSSARILLGHPELRSLFEEVQGSALDIDNLSALIMVCGATFLIAHEVAHHYNAHLYYLCAQPREMILDESPEPWKGRTEEFIDRQALELHADSFALDSTIRNLNDQSWRDEAMALLNIRCSSAESATLCATSLAVAFLIIFLTLRFSKEDGGDQQSVISQTDHPTPHLRLLHALSRVSREDEHDGLPPKATVRLLTVIEMAWPGSNLKDWLLRKTDITKTEAAQSYLKSLWERVDHLSRILREHRWR